MKKLFYLICSFVFSGMQSYASTEAKFSFIAKTPTSVTVPANRHAYVQYTVTNTTLITRTLTMVPIPYVTQRTDDSSQCSNPFVLSPGQSCNLTLYVNGSAIKSKFKGGPVVCKTLGNTNQPDKFLCSRPQESMILSITPAPSVPSNANKLYVTNWDGNNISLCDIISGNLKYCLITATSNTFAHPEAVAISNNVLFVANIGGGISSCIINSSSGELSNCGNAIPSSTPAVYAPTGISIQGTTAYIADSGPEQSNQGVTTCTVAGAQLNSCTFNQGSATFSVPSDLAIIDNTVYVTNFNNQDVPTTYCMIMPSLCTSGLGTITGTSNLLNEPEGIYFATIGGINYAYFTNHGNNTVVLCTVSSSTTFSNCKITGGYFSGFGNLAILNAPLKAFIPSGLKSIGVCDVSSVDGSLSNCVNSNEFNFNNPSGLIIQ